MLRSRWGGTHPDILEIVEPTLVPLDLSEFARETGTPGYDNAVTRLIVSKLERDPTLHPRLLDVMTRRIEPSKAFSKSQIVRWALGALCVGNFGVIKPCFASGEKSARLQCELAMRRELRDAVAV